MSNYCIKCMKPLGEGEVCSCGFKPQEYIVESYHLTPGTLLKDRYFIGSVLGEGGFGITYIGMDTVLERKIAVKEFFLSGYANRTNTISMEINTASGNKEKTYYNYLDKFLDEGKIMAKFGGNDGIVSIIDYFKLNNTAYIVMEFVEGQTLKDYCKKNGNVTYDKLIEIMVPVMNALEQIHNQNYIHRDISPDNIMITKKGSGKLLDFGAARTFDSDGDKTLSVILKPGYAPEEQYHSKGKHGPWSDIYALCATMYFCLTGSVPSNSIERMVSDDVVAVNQLVPTCQIQYSNAIMKGMSVKWSDRYSNIAELRKALLDGEWNYSQKAADVEATMPYGKTVQLGNETIAANNGQSAANIAGQMTNQMGYNQQYAQNGYGNVQQGNGYYSNTNPEVQNFANNYGNQYQQNGFGYNNYGNGQQTPEKKKTNIGLIIGIIAAALLVLAAGFAVIGMNSPEKRISKAIEDAENYMDDDSFESAIEEYDKALEYDDENEEAISGKLDAYRAWINSEISADKLDKAEKLIEEAKKVSSDPLLDGLVETYYDARLEKLASVGYMDQYLELAQKAYDETRDLKYKSMIKEAQELEETAAEEVSLEESAEETVTETNNPDFDDTVNALKDVNHIIDRVSQLAESGTIGELADYMLSDEFSPFIEKSNMIKAEVVYETPYGLLGVYPAESYFGHFVFYHGDYKQTGNYYQRNGDGYVFTSDGNMYFGAVSSWNGDEQNGDVTVTIKDKNGVYKTQTGYMTRGLWNGSVNMAYENPNEGDNFTFDMSFNMGYMNSVGKTDAGNPIFAYANDGSGVSYYSGDIDGENKTYGLPGYSDLIL